MGNKKKLSFKEIMTNYGVIIIMVCLIVFTGITRPNFLTTNNLTNILLPDVSSQQVVTFLQVV